MKKLIALLLALCMLLSMAACGTNSKNNEELSETQKIILEAQNMTLEELAKKAIEESNGKMFYGVGNSSRGKTALPLFIQYLQTIDPSYTLNFEWQQPKNNKIFDQLTADSLKETGTFAMTLIQDGNQIQSKMVATGILDTFIPKDWADANGTTAADYKGFLPLQTLNKVFTELTLLVLAVDECGHTPLYEAACYGHIECVKLLIAAGADVNKADKYGHTPLNMAAGNGHTECERLLIAAGANHGEEQSDDSTE